jgi:hypothetical protein
VRRILLPLLLLTPAGSIPLAPASAQITILDRGEFEVTIDGLEVGTETFTIRQIGAGGEIRVIAAGQVRANLSTGPSTMDILMELTGSEWVPSTYQNKVGGVDAQQIGFELRGTRFESRVTSDLGEQVKEYRALPGTAILERGVAHHFHFLGPHLRTAPAGVPVIVPRGGLQLVADIVAAGTQDVRIGQEVVSARRCRVTAGSMFWEVWYDDDDRVLRVLESSTGYSATRKALPGS